MSIIRIEPNGTVTSVATNASLTGGPITVSGTLSINTSNENTWTGKQTFYSIKTNEGSSGISGVAVMYAGTATIVSSKITTSARIFAFPQHSPGLRKRTVINGWMFSGRVKTFRMSLLRTQVNMQKNNPSPWVDWYLTERRNAITGYLREGARGNGTTTILSSNASDYGNVGWFLTESA